MAAEHLDIAILSFNAVNLSRPPRTVESIRPYLEETLKNLPIGENYGYVKAPNGAENSITLEDGTFVRVARVMTPDGQLYKIMNDVPNGGPQWVAEDIRPDLYHPYPTNSADPIEPPDAHLDARVSYLEHENERLSRELQFLQQTVEANRARMEAINTRMNAIDLASVKKPLPSYIGSIFGYRILSTPVD